MLDEKRVQLHREIVNLLEVLTDNGKAIWFRRKADPEYVFCMCERDLLIFELSDGTEENATPFENPHGITLNIRNVRIAWLEGLDDEWSLLNRLVKSAKIDESKLADCKISVLENVVKDFGAY